MNFVKLKLVLTIGTICIAGCSSHSDRPDRNKFVYQEQLETKILPDGSKVFNFSLAMKPRVQVKDNEQAINKGQNKGKRGERKGERKAGQKTLESNQGLSNKVAKSAEALTERFQARLDSLRILKMFCRQGYFVLEEHTQPNKMSIKAECKEGASASDYQKFTKVK